MKNSLALVFIILFVASCTSRKDQNQSVVNLNEKFLKQETTPLGTGSFRAPKNWVSISKDELKRLDSAFVQYELKGGYVDQLTEAFLVYYETFDVSLTQNTDVWLSSQPSSFVHNGISVQQTVYQTEELVMFEVIPVETGGGISLFVPRNEINLQAMVVESVIASLNLDQTKK